MGLTFVRGLCLRRNVGECAYGGRGVDGVDESLEDEEEIV